nr:NADH dehydrogenase subunit 2 [Eurymetra natalensis]
MMKMSTKKLMIITMIMSTILVISSENWMSMWMGLEINMMSFIPLMEKSKDLMSSESKMMYFLIQSLGSILFMFTIITEPLIMISENMIEIISMNVISMSMMMKMGMAPMHAWFINIMNKLNWNNCLILMTWQKMAPMFILSNTIMNQITLNILSMTSVIIGAIGGINQTSIKKMMAFSSLNHLGWMTMCMKFDNEMWIKYLIIYSAMLTMILKFLSKKSIMYMNQMNMNLKTQMEKMNLIIMMLSLGGLPPFIGFIPKWMVIQSMINTKSTLIILILMMSSMITLFYYMRMVIPMILNFSNINKWNIKSINMNMMNKTSLIINTMLPLTMMINMF